MKPTVGDVDMDGVLLLTSLCDSAGPMAKSVRDLIVTLNVMVPSKLFEYQTSWADLKVGFADPDTWNGGDFCPPKGGSVEQLVGLNLWRLHI
jgi:Asp-tRNA(Asn)/Glu-tRNA(Gln) amidotransferase A subunit family amidase